MCTPLKWPTCANVLQRAKQLPIRRNALHFKKTITNVPKHMEIKKRLHQLDGTCKAFHKLNAANKEHCKKFKTQRKRGQCTQLGPERLLSVLFICSVLFMQHF